MREEKAIKFSKEDQDTLQHLADLAHLFHHRNKNQHRRSIWWRHFSILRKQLNAILVEIKQVNDTPETHLERARKKLKDKERRSGIARRLDFWEDVLVVKWQDSFSQLVADARFASLGLVLLAMLAQMCRITGIIAAFEDLAQREVVKALHDFEKEYWEDKPIQTEQKASHNIDGDDIGEVVNRETLGSNLQTTGGADVSATTNPSGSGTGQKQPPQRQNTHRKKRKRGDAIDELFSGLE